MNKQIQEKKPAHIRRSVQKYSGGMVEQRTASGIAFEIILTALMVLVILICVVPMWHVLMSSLSDGSTLLFTKGIVWWPVGVKDGIFNLEGYKLLVGESTIWSGYANTLLYVFGATAFGFVLNVIGGYTLSRHTLFERPLAFLTIFTMMFSGGLVPTYIVLNSLGMVGTRWALLIPGCTNGIFMLLMSNAFRDVPEATVEAAEIDGAGHLTTMFKVMLPQAMSLATVVILNSVIIQWNSWYPASIYVPARRDAWPLQLWIKDIIASNQNFLQTSNPDYNRYLLQYITIVIATAPILIAFPFFLKYIEKGVIIGGVKE